MNVITYIKLHGRGDLPLPLAYLANFLLVSGFLSLCLLLITKNIDWNTGLFYRGIVVYTLFFSVVIYTWGAVGAFRAMLKYEGKAILYIAYPVFFISVIRFVVFYRSVLLFYFG